MENEQRGDRAIGRTRILRWQARALSIIAYRPFLHTRTVGAARIRNVSGLEAARRAVGRPEIIAA